MIHRDHHLLRQARRVNKSDLEMVKIKQFLERVRKPQNNISLTKQIAETAGIILFGFVLGVLQKLMDGAPTNAFLEVMQQFGVGNYFGRLAIWILLATIISVYAKSPLRAVINTFCFFISILAGYYLYTNYVLGFLPRAYMMIWIVIAFASFFMAYICWYAKGEGFIAIILSSVIIGVLLAQAFSLRITQGFYVYHALEVFTWLAGVLLLRRKPKEYAIEIGLSIVIAIVLQMIIPYWG